jgi:LuxR family maltose regulon positive regulatory protein
LFAALTSPGSSVPGSVVPRLGAAFSSMTSPVALVLDDVHVLHNRECRAALSVLADHVSCGSRLVLAGRREPPLWVARLRAEGRITEIGPADLSLTCEETASLLHGAGVMLGEDQVAALHGRTEGWPTGPYLAALYFREGDPPGDPVVSFGGGDRLVNQYLESEFLAAVSRRRVFLTRTAVLDRTCGPQLIRGRARRISSRGRVRVGGRCLVAGPCRGRGALYVESEDRAFDVAAGQASSRAKSSPPTPANGSHCQR